MVLDSTETGGKAGLKINAKKTVLSSKIGETDTGLELTIKGENIKSVEEVINRGQTLVQDRLDKEITKRISQAWKNFSPQKSSYKTKPPLRLKSKLLEMCIHPTLTYGTQTWDTTLIKSTEHNWLLNTA